MKKFYLLILAALVMSCSYVFSQTADKNKKDAVREKMPNRMVDNNGYWIRWASIGKATLNPVTPVKPAVYTGSEIRAYSVLTEDSPDVAVVNGNSSTQSENSIFVDPYNNMVVLNSNNSTDNPVSGIYGANSLESFDGGLSWDGSVEGAGGSNSGDPVALISLDGTYYIGAISGSGGQQVSRSTNQGQSYTVYNVANSAGGWNDLLDKNHLWIDNSPTSPYEGYLYDAWTLFEEGSSYQGDIFLSRSTNGGSVWSPDINVSNSVANGDFCQGVNINSGPNGEVYVIWAVYTYLPDESNIGMTRSFDGGATFEPAHRVITNIQGIRETSIGKTMRKNSFPSMAVDISGGEYNGNLYVVWANIGVPGQNGGNDVDVYMVRSSDQGDTWSTPVKVNQDPSGLGKKHYFPWITCDPSSGVLSVVFYDDRNVASNQCEVYCANSYDGGVTWEDFKVSDVAFTPNPIPGLASQYMGDYLGINARDGWVYPAWTDNRNGTTMTYVSPYQTNPLNKPTDLTASVTFETGMTDLEWAFEDMAGFSYFKIYRGSDSVGVAYDTVYQDQLPTYGVYLYKVTAKYDDGKESSTSTASVQWGDAQISVNPLEIEETLMPENSVTRMVTISNIGQLEMNYNISMFIPTAATDDAKAYCYATGGACDEFIVRVQLNEIDNITSCDGYANYTSLSTNMIAGNSYDITVTNGGLDWPTDRCGLWVDWNQNEVFDAEEEIPMNGTPGVGPYTAQITVPNTALPGSTRLRTRIVYNQTPTACGESSYGEVEDYTVNVSNWIGVSPMMGNVPAGQTMDIAVQLNSYGMALGDYTAVLNVFSNDPDDPEITVPITLHVAEVAVNVEADADSVCYGETVEITSAMTGGSGTFTYTWTSNPEGFSSTQPNISVTPEATTTYILSVFDGTVTVQDQVTIQVNPLPTIYLGADTTICQGESVTLDAGPGLVYLWSTNETTQTIQAATSGNYSCSVSNQYGCSASDELILTVNLTPEKPVITSGTAQVDNFTPTSTVYTCGTTANADTYQWAVTPAEAGMTTSNGTSAEFFWTSGYTGSVLITVTAGNDCFTSEVSDAFPTTIYTSAGIGEFATGTQLIIYPNPTEGMITLKLPAQKSFTGDVTMTDAGGAVVYIKKGITVPAGEVLTMDLEQLPDGVYSMKLANNNDVYYGRIIVK